MRHDSDHRQDGNTEYGIRKRSKAPSAWKILKSVIPLEAHWKIKLLERWEQITSLLPGRPELVEINGSVLVLRVYNSAFATELRHLSDSIIAIVADVVGPGKIMSLCVRTSFSKRTERIRLVQKNLFGGGTEVEVMDKIIRKQTTMYKPPTEEELTEIMVKTGLTSLKDEKLARAIARCIFATRYPKPKEE